ncbi:uncharacterized protein [Rutidosis leptorrhynchoides]|uniref:uncharacterized protein n=1 Tax=Rutidosis leptorrhynchoides TaxID=125765 RepID=UPI003A9A1F55
MDTWGPYKVLTEGKYRFSSPILKNKSPYGVLSNKVPNYDHLKVFGCLALASNPSRKVDNFTNIGVPCVFLGYPSQQKGYKLYILLTHTTFVSRDVVFHDHILTFSTKSLDKYLSPMPNVLQPEVKYPSTYDVAGFDSGDSAHTSTTGSTESAQPSTSTSIIRSSRIVQTPEWHKDYVLSKNPRANQVSSPSLAPEFKSYIVALMAHSDPTHFQEAINDVGWCNVMNDEMTALEANYT